ncbi:MAG: riboflavin synthase [Calditrichae bacterium]|nr:riboflavin synthase [Calditrichota bacterium]MCB9059360.1 riboflavin synthase [Calditrichia bacterium]
MFTGIIEETGTIAAIDKIAGGLTITISASAILDDLKVDDSVAVNGVCLTVTKLTKKSFTVDAVAETLQKSTMGKVQVSRIVNLERAVRLQDRLGGHLVQGHVNGLGKISRIEKLGENYALDIEIKPELAHYMIAEGSIALDGISLTIARLHNTTVGINIIPHTWANTNLQSLKMGDYMNVEVDVIAKYVENMLTFLKPGENTLTWQKLKESGF